MNFARAAIISLITIVLLQSGCLRQFGLNGFRHLEKAEELMREKRYGDAIEAYRKHIDMRLALSERPEWENPYFYLLMIGDIQLAQNDLQGALSSFEQAEKEGVDKGLVSDRYRFAASQLEKQGKLVEALAILQKYRDRDELLFDLMLDRISKLLVLQEEESHASTATAQPPAAPRSPVP